MKKNELFPSQKLDQYMVRFPDGMRQKLKDIAAENGRSLNAEIIHRLEQSLTGNQVRVPTDDLLNLHSENAELRKTVDLMYKSINEIAEQIYRNSKFIEDFDRDELQILRDKESSNKDPE